MTDQPDANPFAPPRSDVAAMSPPIDAASGVVLASRGARLGAALLDCLFGGLVGIPGMMLTNWHGLNADGTDFMAFFAMTARVWAPAWIVVALVQGWFVHAGRQTLGKKLVGIRVARPHGRHLSFTRHFFGRGGSALALAFIPLVGGLVSCIDFLMIFRVSRRCLHDQIADTIVVTAASSPAPRRAAAGKA